MSTVKLAIVLAACLAGGGALYAGFHGSLPAFSGHPSGEEPRTGAAPEAATAAAPAAIVEPPDETARLRKELSARESDVAALQAEVDALREDRSLGDDIDGLRAAVAERDASLAALRAEVEQLRAELAAAVAPAPPPAEATAAPSDGPLAEVHFESASADLTPGGRERALDAARRLANMELAAVRIVGHTDSVGDAAANEALARARAATVADFLVEAGIDLELIEVAAMGESAPPIRTPDEVAEPLNRCVGIVPIPASTTAAR